MLNPNALNQYEIKYFIWQVGRKAQLVMEFYRFSPANYYNILESQLPSCEEKKNLCPRAN